jgi:hypothetical protein
MKILSSLLAILFAANVATYAVDFLNTPARDKTDPSPTLKEDDHDQPVFTSPTNSPGLELTNSLPAMTNLPSATSTNLPPMTNWPANKPPAVHN